MLKPPLQDGNHAKLGHSLSGRKLAIMSDMPGHPGQLTYLTSVRHGSWIVTDSHGMFLDFPSSNLVRP